MIICICNRINERAARSAVQAGAGTPREVLRFNGCDFNCGKCKCEMNAFIKSENESTSTNDELFVLAE